MSGLLHGIESFSFVGDLTPIHKLTDTEKKHYFNQIEVYDIVMNSDWLFVRHIRGVIQGED